MKAALFAELGTPTEPLPFAPEVPPVLNRRGTLVPRDRFSIPFSLLGPGRRVTLAATISKPKRKGIRARAQLVCDGHVVVSRNFEKGRSKRAFDIHNLGPADCDVRLVSNTGHFSELHASAHPGGRGHHLGPATSETPVIMRDIGRKSLFWPERAPHGALTPTSASQHTRLVR